MLGRRVAIDAYRATRCVPLAATRETRLILAVRAPALYQVLPLSIFGGVSWRNSSSKSAHVRIIATRSFQ